MGRVLRVFDFDDTLAKSTAYIYVTHKDGTETTLDPGQYAKYKPQRGDEFDFRDFNSMLNNPKVIKKNFKLLQKMLSNPEKKVTILTARALGFPIRKFFKDTYGMDVYLLHWQVIILKTRQIGLRNILKKDILISHLWMTQSRM